MLRAPRSTQHLLDPIAVALAVPDGMTSRGTCLSVRDGGAVSAPWLLRRDPYVIQIFEAPSAPTRMRFEAPRSFSGHR